MEDNEVKEQKELREKYYALENTLGYKYQNLNYLVHALTHRSAGPVHYERLEFLGDSILGMIIADSLYHQFDKVGEGDLTRMRSTLVRESTLAEIAREFKLSTYLIMGSGEMKSGGFRRESILADVVEAILASIYLDSEKNFSLVQSVLLKWFGNRLKTIHPGFDQKDSKTQLQEYLQGKHQPLPGYKLVSVDDNPERQHFTISLSMSGYKEQIVGYGSSRRRAEQNAALKALDIIHEHTVEHNAD